MGDTSKRYDEDFKRKIVRERKEGVRASDLSKEYDLPISTINKWVNIYKDEKVANTPVNSGDKTVNKLLNDEIKELKNDIEVLRQTILILLKK
ncbi:MAG: transposase [Clostridium sp.]|uniref:transposase n=1 Tax=Clostridium sp. TaxID=1506 RepID=UPI003F2C5D43